VRGDLGEVAATLIVMSESQEPLHVTPGEFYEDCRYHPMLCVETNYEDDELVGISLITGDIGSCSPTHCGVVELTVEQAIERRLGWNEFVEQNELTEFKSSHYPHP
jgi:hypothetical protein